MSHHARIEEVSDSEPEDMDPADFDPASIFQPTNQASGISALSPADPRFAHPPAMPTPPMPTQMSAQQQQQQRMENHSARQQAEAAERSKNWQALYPVYFDASRTRAEGRRVGREQAVRNPLAREIVDACQGLGASVVFEPGKTHPKDWSNPGRVRVLVKEEGEAVSRIVKNKHHLYTLVSAYLRSHPTTTDSPLRLRIQGVPVPKETIPPAIPRGWKMNDILPLHSPALSGGGVSENMFRDMMAEMGGGGEPAGPPAASEGGKKKKDKKKGKA